MTIVKKQSVAISGQDDLVQARHTARQMAREEGFSSADQARLATVAGELARNALLHAGKGVCNVTARHTVTSATIAVSVVDEGPGIADIQAALTPGFSANSGWGGGLAGTKRLVDTFDVQSRPGHTEVSASISRPL